jgi:hypothetical protein
MFIFSKAVSLKRNRTVLIEYTEYCECWYVMTADRNKRDLDKHFVRLGAVRGELLHARNDPYPINKAWTADFLVKTKS